MASEIPLVESIHFIITHSFHKQKCMIPCKFVEKYGKNLPRDIYLKTSNGEKWKISLAKSGGEIWFGNGWKEFAEFHSLSHYHLLVFRYERTSHFKVHIFDEHAVEINYPLKRVDVNNEEDCRASQKRKAYSSFEIGSTSCVKVGKSQKCKGKQVNAILERAKEFKTCNPSFVLVMGASYVEHHFLLTIPSNYGKTHFDMDKKRGNMYFQVSNGEKVWPAKYGIRMHYKGQIKFELIAGWMKFSKDNNLKVGDVCNFELILRTNMTFLVHIFRKTNEVNTNCSTSQSRIH
ncbi:putative B3 domain-containing protein Os03g0621600 [Lathyrus oleraceus]|uniref:putative B3 domain-containing protein Os03g0621600 n=1 Tax=Pisum sativum TaxID=3888 RepID=UPI0021D3E6C4|nr:putative B3 domain-containing protein Os03g0621600 [Pisum sativum]